MNDLIMFIMNNSVEGSFELLFVSSIIMIFSFILALIVNIKNKGE